MARAHIGLGSNLGDKRAMIHAALQAIDATPGVRVTRRSADYSTPPWGKVDQDFFVNAAAVLDTTLLPLDLLHALMAIETQLGRSRQRKWGPRLIDIDLLEYEGMSADTPELVLPHPYLLERAFVLVPLCEIAPDLMVGGTSIRDALASCDATGIWRLEG